MAASDIGVKIKVEGVSKYKKDMQDSAKRVKTLRSELSLAEAQFRQTGNAEELMQSKGKVLREQILEQTRAVDSAKKALAELRKKGYSENSAEVTEWRGRLAQSRQQLLDMNHELANNEQGLDKAGKAYSAAAQDVRELAQDARTAKSDLSGAAAEGNGLSEALKGIGQAVGWQGVKDGISKINGFIDTSIKKVGEYVKEAFEGMVEASNWADDLMTQSVVYGLDQETLQRWRYAAEMVDVDVTTIIGARKKLISGMASTSEETIKAFNTLGVRTRTSTGQMRDANDVFWETIEALGKIPNETAREALAMQLLGKSASELNPLFAGGRSSWEEAMSQALTVTEESVEKLGELNDAWADFQADVETAKLNLAGAFAPIFTDALGKLDTLIERFNGWVISEEGQKALKKLSDAIVDLFGIPEGLDDDELFSTLAGNLTQVINDFGDLIKDKDKIVNAFEAIGLAIAGMKIAGIASTIASMVANLRTISGWKPPSTLPGTTPTTAPPAVNPATVGTGATTMALSSLAPAAVGISMGVATLAGMWTLENEAAERRKNRAEMQEEAVASETAATGAEHLAEAYQTLKKAREDMQAAALQGKLTDELVELITGSTKFQSAAQTAGYGNVDWLTEFKFNGGSKRFFGGYGDTGIFGDMLAGIEEQSGELYDSMEEAGTLATQGMETGFDSGTQSLLDLVGTTGASMADAAKKSLGEHSPSKVFHDIGANAAIGLGNGIYANAGFAVTAAQNLADAVANTMRTALDIHSPSGVAEELGAYFGQGFGIGLENSAALIGRSMTAALSGISLRAPASQTAGGAGSTANMAQIAGMIVSAIGGMSVEIDGESAGRIIAPTVEQVMAEQLTSRRYA